MKVCPACETKNDPKEKYCLNCGQKLIEDEDDTEIKEDKLTIPKDKINEHELVDLIKDNYVILITASPYYTSYDSLKHIEENTDLKVDESYWNFNRRPPELKRYWLEKAVLPTHGNNPDRYLAIESNKDTRAMYAEFGIEARPKSDFI